MKLIDTSTFSGCWPFFYQADASPQQLKAVLQRHGVDQAWVSPANAILLPDPMPANNELLRSVRNDPFFLPIPIVDPSLKLWQDALRACCRQRPLQAIKLTPGYHPYQLDDPCLHDVLVFARQEQLLVCLQARMADERSVHSLMTVPRLDISECTALVQQHPDIRFLLCGLYASELAFAANTANLAVELSFVESNDTLADALQALGRTRLVFGSHSPLLAFESARAKLSSPSVTAEDIERTACSHAEALLMYHVKASVRNR